MADIIIHEETETPVEEIVEDLTETTEEIVEDLTDTIETLAETIEDIVEENHEPTCDIHCQEMHNKLAELEERINVTQEHIVDEQIAEIVETTPEPEPEPEPETTETVEEITETEANPLETMIEPPPNRTEKSGPNGFFKIFKAIGF